MSNKDIFTCTYKSTGESYYYFNKVIDSKPYVGILSSLDTDFEDVTFITKDEFKTMYKVTDKNVLSNIKNP